MSRTRPKGEDPEAVRIPLTGELDLHAFSPRDIPSVVEEYVRACRARGLRHLRLVHGRGRGVQRAVVQRLLRTLEDVASFSDAPPEAGGWGATLVELREGGGGNLKRFLRARAEPPSARVREGHASRGRVVRGRGKP